MNIKGQFESVLTLCLAGSSALVGSSVSPITHHGPERQENALAESRTHTIRIIDNDGDGLPDGWENIHFGNLDQGPYNDPDQDDLPNIVEYRLDTDPNVGNTGEGNACNHPPTLSTSLSSASLREEYGQAVLAEADDPERDPIRFTVLYTSICSNGVDCLDEPEFYVDPTRPLANLYWVPAVGRNVDSPFTVTFYACDDEDACADPAVVSIEVLPKYASSSRIINPEEITFTPDSPDPPNHIAITEGQMLTVTEIYTSPCPSDQADLRVEFSPPLPPGADAPKITKDTTSNSFKVEWAPNHTRGTTTYTITLAPYYLHARADDPEDCFTFTLDVEDKPIITYPQDYITVESGETFDFIVETEGYDGGTITFYPPITKPAGSDFDTNGAHFTWTPSLDDVGRYNELKLRMCVEGEPVAPTTTILLGVTSNGNLLINPDAEFDADSNGIPDGWRRQGENPSEGHILSWVGDDPEHPEIDPHLLKSERTPDATADPNEFGWAQDVYLTSSAEEQLPPDALYEFSCTYRQEDVMLNIQSNGEAGEEDGVGVIVPSYGNNREYIVSAYYPSAHNYESGFEETSWSDVDGCYHHVYPESSDQRTYRSYFTPPPGTRYIQISTYNMTQGKLYVEHCSLKRVYENPHLPPFPKSGIITLLQNEAGETFFPIGLTSNSPVDYNDNRMAFDELRKLGFNFTSYNSGRVSEQVAAGLYAVGHVGTSPYYRSDVSDSWFKQDHPEYQGLGANLGDAEDMAEASSNGLEFMCFAGVDESNYRPERNGAPPDLRELNYTKERLQDILNTDFMLNVMPRDWDPALNAPHAALVDSLTFTWNCPSSYSIVPNGYSNRKQCAKMHRVGQQIRRWQEDTAMVNGGQPKPVFGFGFGVYWWAYWDASYPRWHPSQFIPYHLQRFQVYNQIVNGSCGMWFYGGYHLALPDTYYRYHWSQIEETVVELASLYDVYVQTEYFDEWNSDQYLEAMLKKCNDQVYLIATNPSEHALGDVTITLTGVEAIAAITALFEDGRTNNDYPMITPDDGFIDAADAAQVRRRGITRWNWARSVPVNPDGVSFTDTFIDYAVHVYEIQPVIEDVDTDGLPDVWETTYFGGLQQGPDDDAEPDGLVNIDEYTYGAHPLNDDSDSDTWSDGNEVHIYGTSPTDADTDHDGTEDPDDNCRSKYNYNQANSDLDGVGDVCDVCPDTPQGIPVTFEGCPDCNTNAVWDVCDIFADTSEDCNNNGIPDECDITHGTSEDENSNGRPDECVCADTDVNCDGATDAVDLGVIGNPGNWLCGPECYNGCEEPANWRADINTDGCVSASDLGAIRNPANWLTSTGECECTGGE